MKNQKTRYSREESRRNAIFRQGLQINTVLLEANIDRLVSSTYPFVFSRNNLSKVVQQLQISNQ